MKYEITVDEKRGILCSKARGTLTFDNVVAFTTEVGAKAKETGILKLLFDMRETDEDAGAADAFKLAAQAEERGMTRSHRRAIVHSGANDLYKFFETVSDNKGYVVKTFTDMDEALAWLGE